jgi:hypothetical protein
MTEGNTDGAKELETATETLVSGLTKADGKADTATRSKLRKQMADALKAKPAEVAPAPKAEAPAEVSYKENPMLVELMNSGIEKTLLGIQGALKATRAADEASLVDFQARLLVTDKNGAPDLNGNSGPIKELNADVKRGAGEKLDGTDKEVRDAVASFWRSKQYRMNHLMVTTVRDLVDNEENRARFAKVLEAHPGLGLVEAIQAYYKIDTRSKLEKARESAQEKKMLAEAGLIAIAAATGDMPGSADGEGDGEGDGGTAPETTAEAKFESDVEKMEKLLAEMVKLAKKLEGESKEKAKARLTAVGTAIFKAEL